MRERNSKSAKVECRKRKLKTKELVLGHADLPGYDLFEHRREDRGHRPETEVNDPADCSRESKILKQLFQKRQRRCEML